MSDDILAAVIAAVREETDQPDLPIGPDSDAAGVPGWDSLAHLRIVFALEAATGRAIDLDETYRAENVGALADVVRRSPPAG